LSGGDAFLSLPAEAGGARYDRLLVYALDRHKETPLAVFTPVDILRQTLGIDPCQYPLDLKEMKSRLERGTQPPATEGPVGPAPQIPGVPPDSPEQARLRAELKGKGYIYLPRGNQVYRVNADGTDLKKIAEVGPKEKVGSCQVSWDGKVVAMAVAPPWGQNNHEVRLVGFNGGEVKTVFRSDKGSSVAWTPDSAWMVLMNGQQVVGMNRQTGQTKKVMEFEGKHYACLSADRQGTFYFWAETVKGNAFSVDKDCNLAKGLFTTDMWQVCQPRVSPDGTKMARHDHDYEWLGGNKRGYISEKPGPGEDKFKKRYFFPRNEDMPLRGWMDAPFWSPDGTCLAYLYKPELESLKKAGFAAEKGYSVVAICRTAGGPMVWLAPGGADLFASWGPVPEENPSGKEKKPL
jgi:hypothetical protein